MCVCVCLARMINQDDMRWRTCGDGWNHWEAASVCTYKNCRHARHCLNRAAVQKRPQKLCFAVLALHDDSVFWVLDWPQVQKALTPEIGASWGALRKVWIYEWLFQFFPYSEVPNSFIFGTLADLAVPRGSFEHDRIRLVWAGSCVLLGDCHQLLRSEPSQLAGLASWDIILGGSLCWSLSIDVGSICLAVNSSPKCCDVWWYYMKTERNQAREPSKPRKRRYLAQMYKSEDANVSRIQRKPSKVVRS